MKTIILALALVFTTPFFSNDSATGVNFREGKWKDAVREAEETHKPMFVVTHAEWCGPCRRMQKYIFNDSEVGEFINEHFVSVKLDADNSGDKSRAMAWGVKGIPSMIFLKSDGKEVVMITGGAATKEDFFEKVETALDKLPTEGGRCSCGKEH